MRCLSAAGLVYCLRPRLPTIVSLMCEAMDSDTLLVQRHAVQVGGWGDVGVQDFQEVGGGRSGPGQ